MQSESQRPRREIVAAPARLHLYVNVRVVLRVDQSHFLCLEFEDGVSAVYSCDAEGEITAWFPLATESTWEVAVGRLAEQISRPATDLMDEVERVRMEQRQSRYGVADVVHKGVDVCPRKVGGTSPLPSLAGAPPQGGPAELVLVRSHGVSDRPTSDVLPTANPNWREARGRVLV